MYYWLNFSTAFLILICLKIVFQKEMTKNSQFSLFSVYILHFKNFGLGIGLQAHLFQNVSLPWISFCQRPCLPLISLQAMDWYQCHPRPLTVRRVTEWVHLLGQMQATHRMYNSLAQLVPIIKTENRDVTYHWGSSFTKLDVIHAPTACKKEKFW